MWRYPMEIVYGEFVGVQWEYSRSTVEVQWELSRSQVGVKWESSGICVVYDRFALVGLGSKAGGSPIKDC